MGGDTDKDNFLNSVPYPALITDTIMGMREVAEEIGLKGNPV